VSVTEGVTADVFGDGALVALSGSSAPAARPDAARVPARQWQVVQRPGGLVVRVVPGPSPFGPADVARRVRMELEAAGVGSLDVAVEVGPDVVRTKLGKAPLISALK
jgi:hypothetical protein